MAPLPGATLDGGVDDAQLGQRRVDARALLLEFGDRLRRPLQHILHLHGAALAAGAVEVVLHPRDADGWRAIDIDGVRRRRLVVDDARGVHVARDAAVHVFAERSPFPPPDAGAAARVAGVVAQVAVAPGQRVAAAQPLVCVEAMKMEMWLNAGADGVVSAVHVALRDTVAAGAVLVEPDLDETETRA